MASSYTKSDIQRAVTCLIYAREQLDSIWHSISSDTLSDRHLASGLEEAHYGARQALTLISDCIWREPACAGISGPSIASKSRD